MALITARNVELTRTRYVCFLGREIVRVNGELSRYFGPEDGNIESDFAHKYYGRDKFIDAVLQSFLEIALARPTKVLVVDITRKHCLIAAVGTIGSVANFELGELGIERVKAKESTHQRVTDIE